MRVPRVRARARARAAGTAERAARKRIDAARADARRKTKRTMHRARSASGASTGCKRAITAARGGACLREGARACLPACLPFVHGGAPVRRTARRGRSAVQRGSCGRKRGRGRTARSGGACTKSARPDALSYVCAMRVPRAGAVCSAPTAVHRLPAVPRLQAQRAPQLHLGGASADN
eukprot:IDg11682t1